MKMKKWGAIAVGAMMVATLGMFGCSSNGGSSASSAASDATSDAGYTLVKEGKLTVATSPDFPPFENLEGDEYVGFDIELARAIAAELGVECEFTTVQFDGIVPAVQAGGQVDVGISGITIDPERAESVVFSDPYYIADQGVAVMKGGAITADNVDTALNAEGMTSPSRAVPPARPSLRRTTPTPRCSLTATRPTPSPPCRPARPTPCAWTWRLSSRCSPPPTPTPRW